MVERGFFDPQCGTANASTMDLDRQQAVFDALEFDLTVADSDTASITRSNESQCLVQDPRVMRVLTGWGARFVVLAPEVTQQPGRMRGDL